MSYPIVTVPPEAMVLDAIKVMAAQKKGSVPGVWQRSASSKARSGKRSPPARSLEVFAS